MTDPDIDGYLRLIADRRRRQIIQQLREEAGRETTIDALVDRLYRSDTTAGERHQNREELAIQLYHTALPRLEDYGVVEYDPDAGTVRYRSNDRVETLLDSIADDSSMPCP